MRFLEARPVDGHVKMAKTVDYFGTPGRCVALWGSTVDTARAYGGKQNRRDEFSNDMLVQ